MEWCQARQETVAATSPDARQDSLHAPAAVTASQTEPRQTARSISPRTAARLQSPMRAATGVGPSPDFSAAHHQRLLVLQGKAMVKAMVPRGQYSEARGTNSPWPPGASPAPAPARMTPGGWATP